MPQQKSRRLKFENNKLIGISKKLNESESLLRALIEQAPIGIGIATGYQYTSFTDTYFNVNPMFEKITGRTKDELLRTNWTDITHPDDLPADIEYFSLFSSGNIDGYDMEKRYIRPDGSSAWVHMIISPLNLSDTANYHLCLIEDIGGRKKLEQELRDSEISKAVFMDNLPGMMYRCKHDKYYTMQFVSNGCFDLTGYHPESLIDNKDVSFFSLIVEQHRKSLWDKFESALERHERLQAEYQIRTATGEVKWVWEQGQGIYDSEDNVVAVEGIIVDITDRKNNELMLKYMSEHDALTGLLNIRSFEHYFSKNSKAKKAKTALIMVNVRRFNLINSALGYHYGELLLFDVAKCLLKLTAENINLFHVSAASFVYYISDYTSEQMLRNLSNEIAVELDYGIAQRSTMFNIGILKIDGFRIEDAESALKKVSLAAEQASGYQRFSFSFFNEEMEEKQKREIYISDLLHKSVRDENDTSLFLLFQPIVDLKTSRICGYEALARYRDDVQGVISPNEFIRIAEESQLMVQLGKKITRLVLEFASVLKSNGFDSVFLSINVSAVQLLSDTFLDDLECLIDEMKVNPENLCLEITESIFSDSFNEINNKLEKIRALGMKTAIDDFGTGYSSLAREREMNADILKIDKYFIDKLHNIDHDSVLTGAIIFMAHKLGQKVIAEGVEHEEQRQYLIDHQCDMIQGFLFSKPVAQDAALSLLKKGKPW